MSDLEVFFGENENDAFKDWLRAHEKTGYYLNFKTANTCVLHRADCKHLWSVTFDLVMATASKKIASTNEAALRLRATTFCTTCKP